MRVACDHNVRYVPENLGIADFLSIAKWENNRQTGKFQSFDCTPLPCLETTNATKHVTVEAVHYVNI